MITIEEVLEKHVGLIKNLIGQYQNSIPGFFQDSEDFYQEAIIAVMKRLPKFDSTKGSITTFLHTIVRNRLLDLLRRERNRGEICKSYPFSCIRKKQTGGCTSVTSEDISFDIPVEIPVDALLIEKEMFSDLRKRLPNDALVYMEVCLNTPSDVKAWFNKKKSSSEPCGAERYKKDILNFLNKKGDKKWAMNAKRKLRSALTNLSPNIFQKRCKSGTTTSC